MSETKKPKSITHRVNFKINANKGEIKVDFSPSVKRAKLQDHQILVNGTLAGANIALRMLLGGLPILRPATEMETEAKIYVFKDVKVDNEVFNQRKTLYDKLVASFEETLGALFPDIEYVNSCSAYQQEIVFEMTEEEAQNHHLDVAEIVQKVRALE